MEHKKIHIEWSRCPVYEDLTVTRCYNCQEFYHKNNKCTKKIVCEYCAEEHKAEMCQKNIRKCNNCLQANNKFNRNYKVTHATTDPDCPSHKYHIELLKSKIEYNI